MPFGGAENVGGGLYNNLINERIAMNEDYEMDETWMDGDALASAGWGTDEDYGYYPEDDWGTVESELFGDC